MRDLATVIKPFGVLTVLVLGVSMCAAGCSLFGGSPGGSTLLAANPLAAQNEPPWHKTGVRPEPPVLHAIVDGGHTGYLDGSARLVIAPKYDDGHALSAEKRLGVRRGDRWGFLDLDGRVAIDFQFQQAEPFSEGLAAVRSDEKWGYVDSRGQWAITPRFASARSFTEGLASVELASLPAPGEAGRYAFITRAGQVVIPNLYRADDFHEGLAAVSWDGYSHGFVDQHGRAIVAPRYADVGRYSEGLALVAIDRALSFIDRRGRVVLGPLLGAALRFSDGVAPVQLPFGREDPTRGPVRRYHYVDSRGREIIPGPFEDAQVFSEGRAAVATFDPFARKLRWGYVDYHGKMIVPFGLEAAADYHAGLALARRDGAQVYLDRDGKTVWPRPANP